MKKILSVILILALALSLSVGALAEQSTTEQSQTVTTDEKAITEALELFKALKGSARVKKLDTLKQELEGFVAEGKLTQEQADLILKYYTEQFASRGEKGGRQQNQQQPAQNGRGKQQGKQPTSNGEQNGQQRQQRQQSQPNGSPQNGESNGEVDTTSGATTTKKGK